MKETIKKYLADLEREEGIRILLAVESGSRAWGFPSADSDYDVRIIYIHDPEWYFAVSKRRDTIEYMSDDRLFDLSGWDLRKALTQMGKTNPSFSEWLFSDAIYFEDSEFVGGIRKLHDLYYNPVHAAHHYAGIARNFRPYVSAGAEVNPKKLLYFLRAVLNAGYIIEHESQPPVNFTSLLGGLSVGDDVRQLIDRLISIKMGLCEKDALEVDPRLVEYALSRYEEVVEKLEKFQPELRPPSCGRLPLDRFAVEWISRRK